MPQIKSILCPVDFSEFSVIAYEYAQSLASQSIFQWLRLIRSS